MQTIPDAECIFLGYLIPQTGTWFSALLPFSPRYCQCNPVFSVIPSVNLCCQFTYGCSSRKVLPSNEGKRNENTFGCLMMLSARSAVCIHIGRQPAGCFRIEFHFVEEACGQFAVLEILPIKSTGSPVSADKESPLHLC